MGPRAWVELVGGWSPARAELAGCSECAGSEDSPTPAPALELWPSKEGESFGMSGSGSSCLGVFGGFLI